MTEQEDVKKPGRGRRGIPCGPVFRAQQCHCCGLGSAPGHRIKIPQAMHVYVHTQLLSHT